MKITVNDGTILDIAQIKRASADPNGESYVVDLDDNVHPCSFLVASEAVEEMSSL